MMKFLRFSLFFTEIISNNKILFSYFFIFATNSCENNVGTAKIDQLNYIYFRSTFSVCAEIDPNYVSFSKKTALFENFENPVFSLGKSETRSLRMKIF